MKKKKLKIEDLKVDSFVTSVEGNNMNTVKGGTGSAWYWFLPEKEVKYEASVRDVAGGCWASEETGPEKTDTIYFSE